MDIKHLQRQLAVSDGRVIAKAHELLRLAAVKVPQATLRQVGVKTRHAAHLCVSLCSVSITVVMIRSTSQLIKPSVPLTHAQGEVARSAICFELACSE
jgi:hypothetical protein